MYKEGYRYTRQLKLINKYGNSNVRYYEFKDEKGTELTWITTDYNNCSKNLLVNGAYSFTVTSIFIDYHKATHITIGCMKLKDL